MSNFTSKTSLTILLVAASVVAIQAAAGIKGGIAQESRANFAAVKGPRQQQQAYLPPPPPPPPPAPLAPAPTKSAPPRALATKGPGSAAPIFSAAKVAPPAIAARPPPPPPPPAPAQQEQVQVQEQEPEASQEQQQQQQVQEIDPNPAAQDGAPAILAPPAAAPAASEEEANPRPEPYAFNYAFAAGDSATSGSSQREEQQDASGKVTGFYTLLGEDGRQRRVDYVADASGFRATISTNEMGTAPKNPADVDLQAQSPTDAQVRVAETATQIARQQALANPQPASAPAFAPAASAASQAPSKVASPRQAAASQQQLAIAQLQEPFEQIRQTELNTRARKSRHAPFYLFTV